MKWFNPSQHKEAIRTLKLARDSIKGGIMATWNLGIDKGILRLMVNFGYLERTKKGMYIITEKGKDYLDNHEKRV